MKVIQHHIYTKDDVRWSFSYDDNSTTFWADNAVVFCVGWKIKELGLIEALVPAIENAMSEAEDSGFEQGQAETVDAVIKALGLEDLINAD